MANYKSSSSQNKKGMGQSKTSSSQNKAGAGRQSKTNANINKAGMSREEAGRKGGEAPHTCRGRECDTKSSSRSRSSR